jgi:basic membrane protein A and related proteins
MTLRRALTLTTLTGVCVALGAGGLGAAPAPTGTPRVGLVIDAASLADRSAGRSVYLGLTRAVRDLRVAGRVLTPDWKEGFASSLADLGRRRYDLVFTALVPIEDVDRAARRFPQTTFVMPDISVRRLPRRLPNVRGLVFREQEVGYLVGYLAGLMERRRPGRDVVSSVGGAKGPLVDRYIAGFQAGARAADPGIVTLNGYADDFIDARKCRAVAADQIVRGSGAVFPVAGGCSFGALAAARAAGVWGIGVDADQADLGPHILTSAVKREDVAVYRTVRALLRGSLAGGGDSVFGLANGGLALGRISPRVPPAVIAAVRRVRARIVAGSIEGIPTAVR